MKPKHRVGLSELALAEHLLCASSLLLACYLLSVSVPISIQNAKNKAHRVGTTCSKPHSQEVAEAFTDSRAHTPSLLLCCPWKGPATHRTGQWTYSSRFPVFTPSCFASSLRYLYLLFLLPQLGIKISCSEPRASLWRWTDLGTNTISVPVQCWPTYIISLSLKFSPVK